MKTKHKNNKQTAGHVDSLRVNTSSFVEAMARAAETTNRFAEIVKLYKESEEEKRIRDGAENVYVGQDPGSKH